MATAPDPTTDGVPYQLRYGALPDELQGDEIDPTLKGWWIAGVNPDDADLWPVLLDFQTQTDPTDAGTRTHCRRCYKEEVHTHRDDEAREWAAGLIRNLNGDDMRVVEWRDVVFEDGDPRSDYAVPVVETATHILTFTLGDSERTTICHITTRRVFAGLLKQLPDGAELLALDVEDDGTLYIPARQVVTMHHREEWNRLPVAPHPGTPDSRAERPRHE